jgi:hypothetical protein
VKARNWSGVGLSWVVLAFNAISPRDRQGKRF